jgi:hypothetical protein
MTEFSLDLIRVCRSQGQMVTFALCDRPVCNLTAYFSQVDYLASAFLTGAFIAPECFTIHEAFVFPKSFCLGIR